MLAPLRTREAWLLVACAVMANLVSFLDRQTLAVLSPSVLHDLDITKSEYGWLASAFYAAYFISGPIVGRLLDRHGARRGLLISVPLWSVISALHAFVPGLASLVVLRIALGFAEAPALPGAAQAISRVLPGSQRGRALGLLFVGSSLGAAIAAPIASLLAGQWSWRVAFIGTAVLGLVWIPLWLATAWSSPTRHILDERPEPSANAPRASALTTLLQPAIVGGVLVMLLVSSAVTFSGHWTALMLVNDHEVPRDDVGYFLWLPPLAIDAGSALFGDLFARRTKRRSGRPDLSLFAIATAVLVAGAWTAAIAWNAWSAAGAVATMMFGASAIYTLMLVETTSRAGNSVSLVSGFLLAAQALCFIVANPIIGALADHHTFSPVLVVIGINALIAAVIWLSTGRAIGRAAAT